MERQALGDTARRGGGIALLLLGALLVGGCPFDKPKLEDRWTRIDLTSSSLTPFQPVSPGPTPITVGADITYRTVLTGFAVAELRGSSSVSSGAVVIDPDAARLRMATDIDYVLQNSVTLGRMTRAVTGWDHLIQHVDFAFTGDVPAATDSLSAGLFLLCYMGSGNEIRLADGTDSLVVTPFNSTQYEILPIGMVLTVSGPGPF